MNKLINLARLKNTYFIMRHGRSQANDEEIIISHPDEGTKAYGLTEEGREQVEKFVTEAKKSMLLDEHTIIYASDFIRCKETAEITRTIFNSNKIISTPLLRERYFGNWDKQSSDNYQKTWDVDARDPYHTTEQVESAADVVKRAMSLIEDLEAKYTGKRILLISHGDTLQLLQTSFEKISPSHHRQLPHLETAEIRELKLS